MGREDWPDMAGRCEDRRPWGIIRVPEMFELLHF